MLVQKSGSGLPHVAILDAGGWIQAVHQSEHTVDNYIETLAKANRVKAKLAAMQIKADAGDQQAQIDLLEASVSLHHLEPKVAAARLGNLGDVSKEREARIQLLITKTMVTDLAGRLGSSEISPAAAIEEFTTYEQAGVASDLQLSGIFWQFILLKGMIDRDLESCATAVDKIKEGAKAMGLNDAQYFKELDQKLASMRGSG